MFHLEAVLTVPLSLGILLQSLVWTVPFGHKIERQAAAAARTLTMRQEEPHLYRLDFSQTPACAEVNPQKMQELISLIWDIKIQAEHVLDNSAESEAAAEGGGR